MTPKSISKVQISNKKLNEIKKQVETTNSKLDQLTKKVDILIAIALARSGLAREEVAQVLGVSGKTIERMLPFGKIKAKE